MKIFLFIMAMALLVGSCYNSKKAQKQFGKAAATYPEIPAAYCAITYPPKISVIKGDTIRTTDTIKLEGNVITDTLVSFDTVRIKITKTLPGQTIRITNTVHDTFEVENTAKLAACESERSKVVSLLAVSNEESDKWEGKAKKRFWIMLSLILALLISLYFNLRKLFK